MALILGIVGIVYDQNKLPAVICTLIAGAGVLFYLSIIGISLFCL